MKLTYLLSESTQGSLTGPQYPVPWRVCLLAVAASTAAPEKQGERMWTDDYKRDDVQVLWGGLLLGSQSSSCQLSLNIRRGQGGWVGGGGCGGGGRGKRRGDQLEIEFLNYF